MFPDFDEGLNDCEIVPLHNCRWYIHSLIPGPPLDCTMRQTAVPYRTAVRHLAARAVTDQSSWRYGARVTRLADNFHSINKRLRVLLADAVRRTDYRPIRQGCCLTYTGAPPDIIEYPENRGFQSQQETKQCIKPVKRGRRLTLNFPARFPMARRKRLPLT